MANGWGSALEFLVEEASDVGVADTEIDGDVAIADPFARTEEPEPASGEQEPVDFAVVGDSYQSNSR